MKKDSFYFPHDYNAANDVKCLFLRQQLGMEGYGIFWFLVERLAESGGILPLKIIPVLAMQMQVPDVKVSAVINTFELFTISKDNFFSHRLNEHLEVRKSFSEKGKEGAALRWKNKEANSPPIGDPNAKESKGKEIKESKVNKREGDKSHTQKTFKNFSEDDFIEEIRKYENDFEKSLLNNFFKYWKERSPGGKMKFQLEKTWETNLRLEKWKANQKNFDNGNTEKLGTSAARLRAAREF